MLLGRRVERLAGGAGAFTLGTDQGDTIAARAVVIAAGAGAFGPNRPPLDGLAAYEASGAVQYYVRRREELRGKRVVIAGGGNSAVDWALALRGIAASIAVVHRRAKFRAAPESAAQLDAAAARGEVELVIPYQLHALHGEAGVLAAVEVADLDGDTRRLPADVLLPFFGLSTDLGAIAQWGLALERHHLAVDAGDLRDQPAGRVRDRRRGALSGQAQADPARVRRGGDGGARHPPDRAARHRAAFRVFDDQGRPGRAGQKLSLLRDAPARPVRCLAALAPGGRGEFGVAGEGALLRRHRAAALGCDGALLGRVHRREALLAAVMRAVWSVCPAMTEVSLVLLDQNGPRGSGGSLRRRLRRPAPAAPPA